MTRNFQDDWDKCGCAVCKAHPYKVPKYGLEHAAGCMCDKCIRSYRDHNQKMTCECADCVMHRKHLYKLGSKQQKSGRKKKVSTISLCDVCETFCKSDAMGSFQLWTAPGVSVETKDICPGCVEDILKLLSGPRTTSRPQSYKRPYQPKSDADRLSNVSTEEMVKALLSRQLESGEYKE